MICVPLLAAVLLASPSTPALKTATLDNGLKLIVLEDHSFPVAAVNVAYRVGSRDEKPGQHGIAHLFEHLMFKGSEHFGPGMFDRTLESLGAESDASTTEDMTNYYAVLAREDVPTLFAMEADRMAHLTFSEDRLTSEREVVKEEYRMRLQDQPTARAFEALFHAAFTVHPYAWSPAGSLDDLDRLTLADLEAFYRTHYSPANAVVVVVGDLGFNEVLAQAQRSFGALPRRPLPPRLHVVEPPQTQLRQVTLPADVQLPMVLGGYHAPSASNPDADALEMLSAILSGGESARLTKHLVREQQLASSVGGELSIHRDPGLFLVYAEYLPPHTPEQVTRALLDEIAAVRESGVTDAELQKARNQALTSRAFELLSTLGRAEAVAEAEVVEGNAQRYAAELARLQKVTTKDVQRVARTYLTEHNLTLVSLLPADNRRGHK